MLELDYALILGSNRQPARHLRLARQRIAERFQIIGQTPALRTRDASGARYLNAAVRIRSGQSPDALREAMHAIEDEADRQRRGAVVTLDIDIVASVDALGVRQVLKPSDLERAYVRELLARIGFE